MTTIELDIKSKSEWIEMFPFGLAMGVGGTRPVMIFKDKQEKRAFPVWMNPLDAGIAVSQTDSHKGGSSHDAALMILNGIDVKVEKCLFREVRDNQQYVELHLTGSRKLKKVEVKAEDAISFCLRSGCRFYAKVDYIEKSRVLEASTLMHVQQPMDSVPPKYLN